MNDCLISSIDKIKAYDKLSQMIIQEIAKTNIGTGDRLAELVGVNPGTISKLKIGSKKFTRFPEFDTLEKLALYFGYPLSEFIAILESESCAVLQDKEIQDRRYKTALYSIYHIKEIGKLNEITAAIASQIKMLLISHK